ncbi:MAG: LysR family transcriptional regulator ArgP [Formivibrio sp.]|nr:LysR family transcriptional regulator ArgP [Formivibrio sp.]
MFDYKQLEALEMIVLAGSFDGAARRLHLTQSAISQRIRQLEERFGGVLLVRENPVRPTPAGESLLAHVRQVRRLEAEIEAGEAERTGWVPVRIGINADSLAIGLVPSLAATLVEERLLLECVVDDESYTLGLLKAGEVVGCISTQADALPGCSVEALGSMTYVFVASPGFAAHWFAAGVSRESLAAAPAAVSGRPDSLHRRWLREHFKLEEGAYPCHVIPESHALFSAALSGMGCAIVPKHQALTALERGDLVMLIADDPIAVPLYWQHPARQSSAEAKLGQALLAFARKQLVQPV